MPFETYDDLQQAVQEWLARTDLDEHVPDFIRLAEIRVQTDLDMRGTDTSTSGNFSAGNPILAAPADMLVPQLLRVDTEPVRHCKLVSRDQLDEINRADVTGGVPEAMAIVGLGFRVAPTPAASHPYTLWYTKGALALSQSNQSNELLRRAPNLLLYGALLEAMPFLRNDERAVTWQQFYLGGLGPLKRQEWRARLGGGPLTMRPDRYA